MELPENNSPPGKILIIDDTPYNLEILSNLLSEKGHEVRQALNGTIALMAIDTDPPDLILLDIIMPDMDGYQLCQQLKASENTANIPIIFLTAIDDVDNKVKAFASGGVDYITKPFHFAEILARIENQLKITFLQKTITLQNQQLQKMNPELQKTNTDTELEEFAEIVSHNLKSTLEEILENLDMLLWKSQDYPDRELNRYINQLTQATRRMKQLINSLLESYIADKKSS